MINVNVRAIKGTRHGSVLNLCSISVYVRLSHPTRRIYFYLHGPLFEFEQLKIKIRVMLKNTRVS